MHALGPCGEFMVCFVLEHPLGGSVCMCCDPVSASAWHRGFARGVSVEWYSSPLLLCGICAGHCIDGAGADTPDQIGVGIELLSILLRDSELPRAGMLPRQ